MQTRQMEVDFHVVPGPLARVGQVTIEGDTGIPPDKIRSLTKLKSGAAVKQEHVTRALERLRKNYQKNNHLEAQVSLTERQYQPDTNRVNYIFKVDEGPTVAITTEGAKISKGELREAGPGVPGEFRRRRPVERRPPQSPRLSPDKRIL